MNCLFHSMHPSKVGDKGRKIKGNYPNLPWQKLDKAQAEGRCVYFAVNGSEIKESVTECCSIFFEDDSRPKEEQVRLYIDKNLPKPGFCLDNGNKSLHQYYPLDKPCTPEQFSELQKDLAVYLGTDVALGNPNRLMRLAGAHHITYRKEPQPVRFLWSSDQKFTYEELRAAIPRRPVEEKKKRSLMVDGEANEMLNFVQYLDGYRENGRPGWHTARCPLSHQHNSSGNHSQDSLHVEVATGAFKCHAGCNSADVWHAARKIAVDNAYEPKRQTKGDKKMADLVNYNNIMSKVEQILDIDDPGRQQWELELLAAPIRGMTANKLLNIYQAKQDGALKFNPINVHEFLKKAPQERQWLVASNIPLSTTLLLVADGGVGKTLLTYDIVKSVASGQRWNGFSTTKGKVLVVQADEPEVDTAERLQIANFAKEVAEGDVLIETNWQFTQVRQLTKWVKEHNPVLVVIDSLTATNLKTTSEEKDAAYGRVLYELRNIANECGCTFIVLHHTNKAGGARGSTTIRDNVSEVWNLRKGEKTDQLLPTQRLLEIDKSRSGCTGTFKLELDVDNYSWKHLGNVGEPTGSVCLAVRILKHLEEQPNIRFETEELAASLSTNKETIRKALERLYRKGQLKREERRSERQRHYVYFSPALDKYTSQFDSVSSLSLERSSSNGSEAGQHAGHMLDNKTQKQLEHSNSNGSEAGQHAGQILDKSTDSEYWEKMNSKKTQEEKTKDINMDNVQLGSSNLSSVETQSGKGTQDSPGETDNSVQHVSSMLSSFENPTIIEVQPQAGQTAPETGRKFAVGDWVRVVQPGESIDGVVGEIVELKAGFANIQPPLWKSKNIVTAALDWIVKPRF